MKKLIALLALALALGTVSVLADQNPQNCVDSGGVSHPGSIQCGPGRCCKP